MEKSCLKKVRAHCAPPAPGGWMKQIAKGNEDESACTFFRWLFLHEKRGLEVQNFVTFPNSLWTFRKSKKIFLVFHSVLRWSRRCGLIQPPPLSSNIQKAHPIRVNGMWLIIVSCSCPSKLKRKCKRRNTWTWTWQYSKSNFVKSQVSLN